MFDYKNKTKKAFTLVETLLYIALVGILLTSIVTFLSAILATESKNEAIFEVDQQATFVIDKVTDTIRNAEAINSPSAGSNGNSLSLEMANASEDPTVFSLNGGIMEITEGSSGSIPISTNNVTISGLTFYNLTPPSSPDAQSVKFVFTVTFNSSSGRQESNYTQTYHAAATIRE